MILTLKGAKRLAYANYDRGGDYVIELLTDEEIEEMFCVPGGRRAMYRYMRSVCAMRSFIEGACMV